MKLKTIHTKDIQKEWKSAQEEGYNGLRMEASLETKKVDDNKFHVTASTSSQDRDGDVIVQKFELKNFKKNPVVLDSHNYNSIEHIIGRLEKPTQSKGFLEGDLVFSDQPKGKMAMEMAEHGFLNTVSIGFIPQEFDKNDPSLILKSELLELSVVSVPSNPEALIQSSKDAEKVKDVIEKVKQQEPEDDQQINIQGDNLVDIKIEQEEYDGGVSDMTEEKEPEVHGKKTPEEILKDYLKYREERINKLTTELSKINKSNVNTKKRKVFKILRQLSKDNLV